ncbi:MAG: (d)CMP kinase [Chloroflexi bacterium]|nr:(d)CMP kinase [Chloroflexota bacterium]
MRKTVVIALDGPAGAGKSTVGERLARELGYFYFDTGVLYRAVAVRALQVGADPANEAEMGCLVREMTIAVRPPSVADGRQIDVLLDGDDISLETRSKAVDGIVSRVAASPAVRAGLIDQQRRQVQGAGTVMAGRDIGTVVCPTADLKVYLTASARERARRRLAQIGGAPADLDAIQRGIEERDHLDASRSVAPLALADDAIVVDTDEKSVDVVAAEIRDLLARRLEGVDAALPMTSSQGQERA